MNRDISNETNSRSSSVLSDSHYIDTTEHKRQRVESDPVISRLTVDLTASSPTTRPATVHAVAQPSSMKQHSIQPHPRPRPHGYMAPPVPPITHNPVQSTEPRLRYTGSVAPRGVSSPAAASPPLSQPSKPVSASTSAVSSPAATKQESSDDDVMVDEEMTNRNVCIGMINTDIVVEKPPLILIRDEQFEIVTLESEGRLNTDNYSFKVTSRSVPPRFFGWVPFKDTRVLGPLVDHRLIWWDAVIPRGKANNHRTPIYIILYCQPQAVGTVGSFFERQRLYLKAPPFYNPACRYSNPHAMLAAAQQQQQLQAAAASSSSSVYGRGGGPYSYSNYSYQVRHYNRPSESQLQEQNQKDIESLLSSIPSDVPLLHIPKRKKKKKNGGSAQVLRQSKISFAAKPVQNEDGVIEIHSDNEDEEDEEEEEDGDREEEAEEEEEMGYVDGLTIKLLDHQMKGVSWMMDREENKSSNGGILADMGLGKTIQTIALMVSTMSSEEQENDNHRITLIVTPLALIHQWVEEIKSKTEYAKLRVLKHHGPNRTKNPAVFKNYDVVVTTYQVVSSDTPIDEAKKKKKPLTLDGFLIQDEEENSSDQSSSGRSTPIPDKWQSLKKGYGPLFQVHWYRVVLDEAQQIKNRLTKSSLSCSELSSVKRWCLTGTPIQNNVDELYSLLRFLKIQPLSDFETFRKNISIPIQNGQGAKAMERLKAVLRAVMLRRTKAVLTTSSLSENSSVVESSNPSSPTTTTTTTTAAEESISKELSLQLPSREKKDIMLKFSEHERALYELLRNRTKDSLEAMHGSGNGQGGYMNMLCLLLRLRQACDHPQLVLDTIDNDKDILDIVPDVNKDLKWSSSHSCELCGRPSDPPLLPFCQECKDSVFSAAPSDLFQTSTKVRKMIEILEATRVSNPGEKTIIFSQFTSMLDLMEGALKKNGFKFCRYDGSMPSQIRERNLEKLKYDPTCTIMLISLKCGSLGLNLTSANRVILMDIWWNPALEEQAIDRVHRIGQRLPVYVTRLLIDNSVELKIMALQQKKAQLSKGALDHGLVKNTKLTASEIRSLFDL